MRGWRRIAYLAATLVGFSEESAAAVNTHIGVLATLGALQRSAATRWGQRAQSVDIHDIRQRSLGTVLRAGRRISKKSPMDDVGAVLFDVTVACAILLCAVVIAVILAWRREATSHFRKAMIHKDS